MAIHICAEIGSNHNGSLDLALRLIAEAADAGCDSVKVQFCRGATLTSNAQDQATLRPYELPTDWLPRLHKQARACGLELGCSVFDPDDAYIVAWSVDWLKISAYDLCFDDLITACVDTGKQIVLSTAMATAEEIRHAVGLVPRSQLKAVLTGTACYPTHSADVQLWKMPWLRELLPGVTIGFSDHTEDGLAVYGAVGGGIGWWEKHFHGSSVSETPDSVVSMGHLQLDAVVTGIRTIETMVGSGPGVEGPLACEMPLYDHCRRTNAKRLRD